jgi:sn-glycerol 3-phosphate transport system permease protein
MEGAFMGTRPASPAASGPGIGAPGSPGTGWGRRLREALAGYLFLAPTLAVFSVFILLPVGWSLYLSFHEVTPMGLGTVFVGLDNYKELLTSTSYLNSLRVTLLFALGVVPVGILLSLALAILLNRPLKGLVVYRTSLFAPVVLSAAIAGVIWSSLYSSTIGYLNYVLKEFGVAHPPNWLADPRWALLAVVIATVWKEMGWNTIIMLAGLQGIPDHLYEAAKIDGAGRWAAFRHITIPMLSPTLFFVLIMAVIHSFEAFGQIHVLTRGGPIEATNVLVYSIYNDAFIASRNGFASAQAYVLFLIVLLLTVVQFQVLGKRVHYE